MSCQDTFISELILFSKLTTKISSSSENLHLFQFSDFLSFRFYNDGWMGLKWAKIDLVCLM